MRVASLRSQLGTVMQGSIGVFCDIVLLRRGPRDLPAAWGLLATAAGASFAVEFAMIAHRYGALAALAHATFDLALTVALFSALLALRGQGHRLLQTLTALFGIDALLSLPLALLSLTAGGDGQHLLAGLLFLALLAWNLLVIGHIVRVALDVPLLNGVAVAMSFTILSILIDRLWPAAGAS